MLKLLGDGHKDVVPSTFIFACVWVPAYPTVISLYGGNDEKRCKLLGDGDEDDSEGSKRRAGRS